MRRRNTKMDFTDARKTCGYWDEELGCDEDYPIECPYSSECKADAENPEEPEEQ